MNRSERLSYISDAGTVEFSTRKSVTPYWWNTEDGLTALGINIYSSKGPEQDGETYISHDLPARPITIEGQISKNAEANRRKLLSLVNPKYDGRLVYTSGSFIAYIPCRTKSMPRFSRGIFPNFQMDFWCPSPYWRKGDGSTPNRADIALWLPMLEFPVEIPEEGMELEVRSPSLIIDVLNDGDIDAGMTAVFKATAATSNPSLVNVQTQETLSLTINMEAGDEIRVKTGYGEKGAWLTRNGVTTNIFNTVDDTSTWMQIHPGDNLIRYDATVTDNILVTIYYEEYLLGV